MERLPVIKNEHLEFLDNLRESGDTDMFGARPFLQDEYPELSPREAGKVISYWMETFGNEDR